MERSIHLICNAHLDPVWLWEWQEGAAEAISTFRTAAELCEKNESLIFNHNEVILYEWVREYEPDLFKRIQKLVKQGRWHIMGGWYLQPDCNMPSGESLVRQILAGRRYFQKHFGQKPSTAINFDPFGHSRGLVQILAKSGFDSYLFGRPTPGFLDIENNEAFIWIGFDGSEVLTKRFIGWYNTSLGNAAGIVSDRIEDSNAPIEAVLWGVGNHGGGPSRKDIADINTLITQRKDVDIRHSTPEDFFKELAQKNTVKTRIQSDLNPWAIGCYTSMIRIKQRHRQLENELYQTEKMATCAAANKLIDYPQADFEAASKDLMFAQFHDILPGSCIQACEDTALNMMGHGLEILSRIKAKAFFALAAGQKKTKEGFIPVFVYNPHPYPVRQTVECEFNLPDFNADGSFTDITVSQNGNCIPAQVEKEHSDQPIDWRKRIVFEADLEPGQMNRFDCALHKLKKRPKVRTTSKNGAILIKNERMQVRVNTRTGLIDQYRVDGVNYLNKGAFRPVILQDNEDPWEMHKIRFGKTMGRFNLLSRTAAARFRGFKDSSLESVRIIEDGSVRTVVEAVFGYDASFICQRYFLPKHGTEICVETQVFWQQKNNMLKLLVPLMFQATTYRGQTAFGTENLPINGNETVAQKWIAAANPDTGHCLTCINDGIYGSDCTSSKLRLSLLRSPVYSGHPWPGLKTLNEDRFIPRIDQGERRFKFWFNAGTIQKRLRHVSSEALAHNEKPFALSFFPKGDGHLPKPLTVIDNQAIEMSAVKKTESGKGWIVRLFNTTHQKQTTELRLPVFKRKRKLSFGPYEIKTLAIDRQNRITDMNLMEEKL